MLLITLELFYIFVLIKLAYSLNYIISWSFASAKQNTI